jgi:dihydrofolate synthase/folylpolyglutamate synthase
MAFELFRRNSVDWAIFETGLGGRLDATNIIDPQVSIITKVDLDHTEYLGPTILSITKEKLGIVKQNRPLIFTHTNDKQVLDLASQICNEKNAPLHIVKNSEAELISDDENGLRFSWNGNEYKVPLRGSFQLTNALLALNSLQSINITDYNVLYDGLASAFIPGRFQIMTMGNKTVIFDVGHNPNAASVLVDSIQKKYAGRSICIITGIMKDKDSNSFLSVRKSSIKLVPIR